MAAIADEIKADILEHGVDSRGVSTTQRYGDEALDAHALVVLDRFAADDLRVRNTVLAIADELTGGRPGVAYRAGTDDGLPARKARSPSARCSWLVSALVERSVRWAAPSGCERLLSFFASPLLLYAEEIEPRSGRHPGNLPQAFTHLALINAVVHVTKCRGGSRQAEQIRSTAQISGPKWAICVCSASVNSLR